MKKILAIAAISVIGAPGAFAAPISNWIVDQYATFTAFTDDDAPGGSNPVTPYNINVELGGPEGDELRWGLPSNSGELNPNLYQSGLFISSTAPVAGCAARTTTNGAPGQPCGAIEGVAVATDGPAVNTLEYNHDNNVIKRNTGELDTAIISGRVDLTAVDGPSPGLMISDTAQYDITFFETPNAGDCNPPGVPACPDVVGIASEDLLFDFGEGTATFVDELDLGPVLGKYLIFAALEGLVEVDSAFCPENENCAGLITQEAQLNTFLSSIRIVGVEVRIPAPAVPALLGVGLLALFGARRRMAR